MAFGSLVACGNSDGGTETPETPEEFYIAAAKALENASYVETWTEKRTIIDQNGSPMANPPLPNKKEVVTFEVDGDKIKSSTPLYEDYALEYFYADGMYYDATNKKKAPCTETELVTIAANLGFNAQNTGINSYETITVEKAADGGSVVKGTGTKAETVAAINTTLQGIAMAFNQSGQGAMDFEFDHEKSFCEIKFDENNRIVSSHNCSVATIFVATSDEALSCTFKIEHIFTYDYKDVTVTLPNDVDTYKSYNSYMEMMMDYAN